ncbi:MAG: YdeI/OmpD-associated family protein, partial [Candidatus Kariarchaeaceae archaeon]
RYMQRYTPRKPKSKWSDSNRKRVEKMIKEKKMTKHGLIHVTAAKKDGRWELAYSTKKMYPIPEDLENALKEDKVAWENFNNFSKSNQLMYISYIIDAKRDATKKRRIARIVERSRNNEKPGMM